MQGGRGGYFLDYDPDYTLVTAVLTEKVREVRGRETGRGRREGRGGGAEESEGKRKGEGGERESGMGRNGGGEGDS